MYASPLRPHRSGCPIGIALDVFGDVWSLLIVRDLMFKGINTFKGFCDAGEGIATNILSERLVRLEAAGILEKQRAADDGRRFIYGLTQKGIDLAPMLVEMILWSDAYEETAAPPDVMTFMRENKAAFLEQVRQDWAKLRQTP